MNLDACGLLKIAPENRTWFRAIQPQFWPTALATGHTTRYLSRFKVQAHDKMKQVTQDQPQVW